MKYDELPKKLKELADTRTEEYITRNKYDGEQANSLRKEKHISGKFAWTHAEEGHEFWSRIANREVQDLRDDPSYKQYFEESINESYSIF